MSRHKYQKVAVLMGGPSRERDVSLRSGQAVAEGLRESGYEVTEVDVTGPDIALPDAEAVFIALHGAFGEDGQVQAILDAAGMPYTGSGARSSKVCMDKELSKDLLREAGISTPEYEVLKEGGIRTLPLPVVVKPACEGSSIGIHKVSEDSSWDGAMADALIYDERVLVESYIPGRELTCGVVDGDALPVVEVVAPEGWYDYGAKYTAGRTDYLAPAPINPDTEARCRDLTLKTSKALGCRGFGRVDFRLSPDGDLHVLEMNTIPGFTATSLLPKAAACQGVTFSALCEMIMETATYG